MIKVTQADRDAALDHIKVNFHCAKALAEAFAAHRIATINECAKVVQRRADELRCTAVDVDKTVDAILALR